MGTEEILSKRLRRIINNYEIISFDIFDTLIQRNISAPKEIFSVVEQEAKKQNFKIEKFMQDRIDAERKARAAYNREITLDEIYQWFDKRYSCSSLEYLKSLELQVELDFCQQNKEMYNFYLHCVAVGKRIIAISDMYLPPYIIKSILKKCGYYKIDALYISCDCDKTKASGDFYGFVLQEEHVKAKNILHIGDNFKSDIIQAYKNGITALYVKNGNRVFRKQKLVIGKEIDTNKKKMPLNISILNSFLTNNKYNFANIYSKVGYECFGPLLFGYIKWIHEQIKIHNCTSALFLSRDGYIMKQVYDFMCPNEIKTYYFLASRRALQVPALHLKSTFEEVIQNMFIPRVVTVSWLLEKWGLEAEQYKEHVNTLGLALDFSFDGTELIRNVSARKLYNLLKTEIIDNSKQEYEAFKEYLRQFDLNGNVAFIDIGWHGNMQNAFETMLVEMGLKINVFGLYLGLDPNSQFQQKYKMQGYLYMADKNEELYFKTKYICSMIELFFMAPHGSTYKYRQDNTKVAVIQEPFEYEKTQTADEMFSLQEAAIRFVRDIQCLAKYLGSKETDYFINMYNCFMDPTLDIANAFGELKLWDGYWKNVAGHMTLQKAICNPQRAVNDFLHSSWKMGYLKRMFIIPLPYEKVVWILRKKYKSGY